MKIFFLNLPISKKISFLLIAVVSACFLVSGAVTFLSIFASIEKMLGEKLQLIINTGVLMIHAEDHQKIEQAIINQEQNVAKTAPFKKIQKILQEIKRNNNLSEDVYTVIAPDWADGHLIFVAMSNKKTYVGNSIKTREEVSVALKTGKSQYSKIYTDSEGVWVSAFAPILNETGKPVAVIKVDYHTEREIAEARQRLLLSIGIPTNQNEPRFYLISKSRPA